MGRNRLTYYFLKGRSFSKVWDLPLQNKIIISTILLLIIPITITYFFLYSSYINDKKENVLKLNQTIDTQAMVNIDSYIGDIEKLTLQPLYDAVTLAATLHNDNIDILTILHDSNIKKEVGSKGKGEDSGGSIQPDANGNTVSDTDNKKSFIIRTINRLMSVKKEINSVFITNMDGLLFEYKIKDNALYESGYNPTNEDWFKLCEENKSNPIILKSTKYTNIGIPMGEDAYVFPIARSIVDINTNEIVGVICIYSNVDLLRNVCKKIKTADSERIMLINGEGDILYDTSEKYISKSVMDPTFDLKFLGKKDYGAKDGIIVDTKDKYHLSIVKSSVSDWQLLRISPESVVFGNIRRVEIRFISIMFVFVILSLTLTVFMVHRTTRPLKKLISTMNVIEKGDLSVRFKVKHNDEIGQLGNSFNNMIEEIDNLINTVYVSELRKREAELNALQAQINPHFIYNTLESIRMMAELNDDIATSKMTMTLGKLLRYSISTKKQKVTVRQDIEHLKNYIKLQNYRFNDKFQLTLDIDEMIYEANIVKLLFQPIVENAIFHGLETTSGMGIINIKGYQSSEGVCFEIKDNGIGMTAEQIDRLEFSISDFNSIEKDSKSIGLKNINERIKLNYGDDYGLRIYSEFGKGTTITLVLPDVITMNKAIE